MIRFKRDDGSDYPNWEEKKLGDVFSSLEYGMNASATEYDGENKYIRITDINDETHEYMRNDIVSPSGKLEDKYILKKGDIVFARTGASVGKTYAYKEKDGKLYYAGFLIKGSTKSEFCPEFIFAQTLTHKYNNWVSVMSVRSGQPGINSQEYASFKFMCPTSKEEQQKIADFLSSIDVVITASEKEVANLEEQKKGVMQKIFSQKVRFKADNGSDYPEWEEKRVEDLFKITRGYVLSKDKLIEKTDEKILYPVYSSQTLNDGLMGYYDNFLYENAITWTTDGANAGTVKYREGKFYCTNVCGVLISEKYANKCIANILGLESYKHVSQKGANPKLMNNVMGKIKITIPVSIEEQKKIADFLSDFDTAIDLAKQELKQWKELKKGLLQQLFE